jgi:hypothetical protein|nr:MAG TPA: putative peptidyl-prolyl cis-trans isomerase [Caudoviricetes sp.]
MRNKILAVVLGLTLCFGMTGCGSSMTNNGYANFKNADNKYIDMELVYQNNSVYVLYDKNTKVMYLCVEGYNMMGITPIYNSDGTVKLYDGE